MTYNVFIEIAAMACCVYTAFRFGLYLYNKVYSNQCCPVKITKCSLNLLKHS